MERVVLAVRPAGDDRLDALLRAAALPVHGVAAVEVAAASDERPFAEALGRLASFDWLAFTSRHAVEGVLSSRVDAPWPKVACVGEATARAVARFGVMPQLVGTGGAEALALALAEGAAAPLRVLHPCGTLAVPTFAQTLRAHGHVVEEPVVYETRVRSTVDERLVELLASGGALACAITSPSGVEGVLVAAGPQAASLATIPTACLGHSTAQRARAAGLNVVAVPSTPSLEGLVTAVGELLQHSV